MLRVLVLILLLFAPQAHAQTTFPPGTFQNRGPLDAVTTVAPLLDGAAISTVGGTNTNTVTLSVAASVAQIIVIAAVNTCTGGVDTATATSPNLTFTFRAHSNVGGSNCVSNDLIEFYAQSSAPLVNELITVTVTPGITMTYSEVVAFGVKGINPSVPFDANPSLPASSGSGALAIATTSPTDFVFAGFRTGGPPSPDGGWTTIINGSFIGTEYLRTTTAQPSLTPGGSNGNNGGVGDALVSP